MSHHLDRLNAVIENFWSRMRVELLDRQRWRTRVDLANAMFDYLEIFHNRSPGIPRSAGSRRP